MAIKKEQRAVQLRSGAWLSETRKCDKIYENC